MSNPMTNTVTRTGLALVLALVAGLLAAAVSVFGFNEPPSVSAQTDSNSAATGAPTISGIVQVGHILTASVSGIADADGLRNVSYSYLWLADDTAVGWAIYFRGVMGPTYPPQWSDYGRVIKVRVTFTDDAGNEESLTSAGTAAVAYNPTTGHPTISGKAQVGQTLTADTSGLSDPDGLENAVYSFRWRANSVGLIPGATSSSYTLVADQLGKTIEVIVRVTDDLGSHTVQTSEATAAVVLVLSVSGSTTSDYAENGTSAVATYAVANAPVDATVTWSLSGDDSDDFSISSAGVLTFNASPDYENPTDADTDNAYEVTIEASDGTNQGSLDVTVTVTRAANTTATGAPTISGTAQVGETLTADTSGIADSDGIDNATFAYQWLADDIAISGTTGSTYTLTDDEEGKAINVRVSFTDDAGNAETLTSAETAAVAATVPAVPRSIEAERGGTGELDVSWEEPGSNGGSPITGYTVQWKQAANSWDTAEDVSEANSTGTSYTITSLSLGVEYSVRVIATNSNGDGPASAEEKATADAQSSLQRGSSENTPATAAPAISGAPQVGEALAADTSSIGDVDGLTNVTYSYQWIANDGTVDTDIEDATETTYVVASSDVSKTIKLRVSFTDDTGNDETLTSAATSAVEAPLTAELQSVPNSHSGSGAFTFRILFSEPVNVGYAALKQHSFQVSNATIEKAQRVSGRNDLRKFTIQPSSDAAVVLVLPTTEDCAAEGAICTNDGKRLFTRLEISVPGPAPANSAATAAPTISGTLETGQTLTASTSGISDADGLSNAAFSYQWITNEGTSDTDIQGATASTYTLADADTGKNIKVRVSFTDDAGSDETLTSAATAAVSPAPTPNSPATGAPTITGTTQVGETLTASTSDISDSDRMDNATFSYQWLADDSAISGATGYTLIDGDEGKHIKVRVSFTDDAGNDETLTSAATDAVSAAHQQEREATPEPTDRPHGLRVSADADADTVTLNWNAPDDAQMVNMYRILRHRPEEGEADLLVYVEFTHSRATSYTDTAVEPGTLYVYRVQAADPFGFVGEASNPASVRVPVSNSPATGAPAISGTAQVGETLTAITTGISDEDGLTNAAFAYQWLADDIDISGAEGSTYIPMDADQGKAIKVRVSITDDNGNDEMLTSVATSVVVARPNSPATGAPSISGTAHMGETLTAVISRVSDVDGLGNATFSYQWLADDADIDDATGGAYTLVSADEGKAIKVRVSFTDDAGNAETVTSGATAAVEGEAQSEPQEPEPQDPPPAPQNLSAASNGDGTITLTWDAPEDDSVTGYQILRRRPQEGENALEIYVSDTGSTSTGYTDAGAPAGTRYVYRVKAINEAGAGQRSNYVRIDH